MDQLIIAGKAYSSRLLVGTGKYKDFAQTRAAIDASGAKIVTVAIRRTNIGQNANEPSLLEVLPPSQFTILPNTAGCYSAQDAVRTLRLARELLIVAWYAGSSKMNSMPSSRPIFSRNMRPCSRCSSVAATSTLSGWPATLTLAEP